MAVPPQAQYALSFLAIAGRSVFLSFSPSTMVVGFPNLLASRRIRMRCCSLAISPQAQRSLGSPHVGQISAMMLTVYGV